MIKFETEIDLKVLRYQIFKCKKILNYYLVSLNTITYRLTGVSIANINLTLVGGKERKRDYGKGEGEVCIGGLE